MRGGLVPGGWGCSLSGDCVPVGSGVVTPGVGQVQLYALSNNFDPEFFADRFGSDLTMTGAVAAQTTRLVSSVALFRACGSPGVS